MVPMFVAAWFPLHAFGILIGEIATALSFCLVWDTWHRIRMLPFGFLAAGLIRQRYYRSRF